MMVRNTLWRLALVLAGINLSIVFLASCLGLIPDNSIAIRNGRKALCEELALHASFCIQRGQLDIFQATLNGVTQKNQDIASTRLRRSDGTILAEYLGQTSSQDPETEGKGPMGEVAIVVNDQLWGTVEIQFRPERPKGVAGILSHPLIPLILFIAPVSFVLILLYMRKFIKVMQAGPAGLIPRRVRSTMNTLAEGMVILDHRAIIVMANEAFERMVGCLAGKLEGRCIQDFTRSSYTEQSGISQSWIESVLAGEACQGLSLNLVDGQGRTQIVSLNATPICGEDGKTRGIVATFEDQTVIQKKNVRMKKLLRKLQQSRSEIQRQNDQLLTLATRDPLTGCLNRRAFYQELETHWVAVRRSSSPLTCVLVDVDHFKSVNDMHGHGVGDQVLQGVAAVLQLEARKTDLVCRYGGEEFCLVLPNTDVAQAIQVAERIRQVLASSPCGTVCVTASFGVASATAADRSEMLERADEALYAAKRGGRNRVVHWEDLLKDGHLTTTDEKKNVDESASNLPNIPFQAVSALVSALAYRHGETAQHGWRVSDLCVSAAADLLSSRQCYILEIGALLHDIGKLGVPDAILLKPGALTPGEWKTIRMHEGIGQEIIRSAFNCQELTELIAQHRCWYGGRSEDASLPSGEKIPLAARLLCIADAYDAMVSEQIYRKGRSRAEAFAELRRCAGTQFDPVLVERFIMAVESRDDSRSTSPNLLPKQTALRVGLQLERLTHAMDAGDISSVAAYAGHISDAASASEASTIVQAAGRLQRSALTSNNPLEMTQLTLELLEACRVAYKSYLPGLENEGSKHLPA